VQADSGYDISVIIPAYNAAATIGRAIDSVLAQTCPAREIIVVDDGSTDDTVSIVGEYGGRIEYTYQPNAGPGPARNAGIRAARGDWIAFLDADDEWLPHKLACQTDLLARHPDLAWVTGNYVDCACHLGRRQEHVNATVIHDFLNGDEVFESFFQAMLCDAWGCTDTMLIRRDIFNEVGLFSDDLPRGNDFDMWWRIAYHYPRIGFSKEPLAVYHLDVPDSVVRKHYTASVLGRLLERHLWLSEQLGMREAFQPVAAQLLSRWVRGMLFNDRIPEVRPLLKKFPTLTSRSWRTAMYVLTICPPVTQQGCRVLSGLARCLRLRRKVVRTRI